MIRGNSLIDWERAGAELAQQSSDLQIKFFKAFVKECRSWGTYLQVEQQLCHVNLGLTQEEREVLKMIGISRIVLDNFKYIKSLWLYYGSRGSGKR